VEKALKKYFHSILFPVSSGLMNGRRSKKASNNDLSAEYFSERYLSPAVYCKRWNSAGKDDLYLSQFFTGDGECRKCRMIFTHMFQVLT
jgi:hypothetical protein